MQEKLKNYVIVRQFKYIKGVFHNYENFRIIKRYTDFNEGRA